MDKYGILDLIRNFIGGHAFRVFLWASQMTQEQYWERIYQQELEHYTNQAILEAADREG